MIQSIMYLALLLLRESACNHAGVLAPIPNLVQLNRSINVNFDLNDPDMGSVSVVKRLFYHHMSTISSKGL